MPLPRPARLLPLAPIMAFLILGACASAPEFEALTPAGTDLSGHWIRNKALSDDPLQKLEAVRGKRRGRNQRRPPDRDTMLAMIKGGDELLITQRTDALSISVDGTGEQMFGFGESISQINESGVATLTAGWAGQIFNIARWAKRGPNLTQQLQLDAASGQLRYQIHLEIIGIGETTVLHRYDRATP